MEPDSLARSPRALKAVEPQGALTHYMCHKCGEEFLRLSFPVNLFHRFHTFTCPSCTRADFNMPYIEHRLTGKDLFEFCLLCAEAFESYLRRREDLTAAVEGGILSNRKRSQINEQ